MEDRCNSINDACHVLMVFMQTGGTWGVGRGAVGTATVIPNSFEQL